MSAAKSTLSRVRAKISMLARFQALSKSNSRTQQDCQERKHIPDSWKESFENMLEDPAGIKAFTEFLQKEHSEENMKFWVACSDYLKIQDSTKRGEEARNIFSTYLSDCATDPVNVDSQALKLVKDNLENPTEQTFEVARKQIFILMKTDSYRRFLKSDTPACSCSSEEGSPKPNKQKLFKDRMNSNGKLLQNSTANDDKPTSRRQSDSEYANSLIYGVRETTKALKPNFSSGDLPAVEAKTHDIERIEEMSETMSIEEEAGISPYSPHDDTFTDMTQQLTMELIPGPTLRETSPSSPTSPTDTTLPNQQINGMYDSIQPVFDAITMTVVSETDEPISPTLPVFKKESPNKMPTIITKSISESDDDDDFSNRSPKSPHSPLFERKDLAIALDNETKTTVTDSDKQISLQEDTITRRTQSSSSSPSHAFNVISDTDLQSAIDEINALTVCMKDELVSVVQPELNMIKQQCAPTVTSELSH